MQTNQFLKVYNSLLELEKYFIELKGRESKDKEVDDMDKFEEKQMNKIRAIKNIWYHCLINYIPRPIRKTIGGFKDKLIYLFKTKQTVYGTGKKLNKSKAQNQSEKILLY